MSAVRLSALRDWPPETNNTGVWLAIGSIMLAAALDRGVSAYLCPCTDDAAKVASAWVEMTRMEDDGG